uniref:Exodeoxyribonuclease 7 large subunit n=1 Tax=Candidatus Kentrum sp. FW TaxID=2126338 RepID=A0A450TBH6_9GAMM|nr:MAG: Exodeoxyribonuclease VII large subunit [Candidatus Kentron sp. FW]VFJ64109.1 MAG: Exodeoxyribonuclease VII large subunit [Candidatus Kentron sp. FW]
METEFPTRDIYTVSRLNQEVRYLIEANFPTIWVEGEISNLACPRSGHIYFSLKDEDCQVRCAMFRMQNRSVDFALEDGVRVLAQARPSIYPRRGDFQLIVEYLEEAGEGALRRAFEILKKRLAAEGLFDASHKKPRPIIPDRIGVITSPSGAAIRDILTVLKRRLPGIPVLIYPTLVQGDEAAAGITRMIQVADDRQECDVLILARGGGSLEDLQAFNEETVARAIHHCRIPVISAIGHEIDFTIADFVADERAATPSAAAELVVPDQREWRQRISATGDRILALTHRHLAERHQNLAWLHKRLTLMHPRRQLSDNAQRLDELMHRLTRYARAVPPPLRSHLAALAARLYRHEPSVRIKNHDVYRRQLAERLVGVVRQTIAMQSAHIDSLTRALEAMNPQRTLERGYAIVTKHSGDAVLRHADQAREGEQVEARLARGTLYCRVIEVETEAREE